MYKSKFTESLYSDKLADFEIKFSKPTVGIHPFVLILNWHKIMDGVIDEDNHRHFDSALNNFMSVIHKLNNK